MDKTITSIIGVQVILTVVVALILLVSHSTRAAYSALIGGAIGFVPSIVYAIKMYSASDASALEQLKASYVAEFLKIAVTLLLFAATFIWLRDTLFWSLFAAYIATLAAYWVVLFFDMSKQK